MNNAGAKTPDRFTATLLIAVSLVVCPCAVRGQINSGSIAGFVSDPSGASIPEATVLATNVATRVVTQTATSPDGNYLLNYLVPGTY